MGAYGYREELVMVVGSKSQWREASSEGGETCWRIKDGREDASTL
jgi:hypothetical protein